MTKLADLIIENKKLISENEALTAALDLERQRFSELKHRVKSELFAHSILFATQRRIAGQPEQCALCVARIGAAAALHHALDDDNIDVCDLQTFLPFLIRNFQAAFGDDAEFRLSVETTRVLGYRQGQSLGLFFAEVAMRALKRQPAAGRPKLNVVLREFGGTLELTIDDSGAGAEALHSEQEFERLQSMVAEFKGLVTQEATPSALRTKLVFPH